MGAALAERQFEDGLAEALVPPIVDAALRHLTENGDLSPAGAVAAVLRTLPEGFGGTPQASSPHAAAAPVDGVVQGITPEFLVGQVDEGGIDTSERQAKPRVGGRSGASGDRS